MPAHNDDFPWLSYYGNYEFFEQRMLEHNQVDSYENIGDGLYNIRLTSGRNLKVFICECYAYGSAEYIESCENYGKLDAVVINGNWCGYSLELKHECMQSEVGIFTVGGFMAAINRNRFWTYLTDYEKEQFQRFGWL